MYHQNDYLIRQQVRGTQSNDCCICLYYFLHYFRFRCADVAYKQLALLWLLREGSTEVSSSDQSLKDTWFPNIQLDHSYATNPQMWREKEEQKVTVRRVKMGDREVSSLLSFPQEPLISLCNIQQGLDWHYFIFNSTESLCHVHTCYFPSSEWQPAAHWSITM